MPAARRGSALVAALDRQLLIAAAAAAGGGRLPDHSWEHLPVAWHSALSTEDLSAAALANLSKYPLVTLEKTAGSAYGWPHGLPLSDAELRSDGIWRWDFAAGTKVAFNTKTNNGTIRWASLKSDDSSRVKADDSALSVDDGAPGKGAAQHVKVLFLDDADIEGGVSGLHGDLELRMNPPAVADGFAIQPDRPWERLGEHDRLQSRRFSRLRFHTDACHAVLQASSRTRALCATRRTRPTRGECTTPQSATRDRTGPTTSSRAWRCPRTAKSGSSLRWASRFTKAPTTTT
jgi:hypothetical protein